MGAEFIPPHKLQQHNMLLGFPFQYQQRHPADTTCFNTSSQRILEGNFKEKDEDGCELSCSHDSLFCVAIAT